MFKPHVCSRQCAWVTRHPQVPLRTELSPFAQVLRAGL